MIAQTGSILRYIARLADKDDGSLRGAQADAAFEATQEPPMAQIYVAVNLMEEQLAKSTAGKFKAALPRYLQNWTRALGGHKYFHGAARLQTQLHAQRC